MGKMSLFTSGVTETVVDDNGGKEKYAISLVCGDVEENGEFSIYIRGIKGYEGAKEALEEALKFIEQEKID